MIQLFTYNNIFNKNIFEIKFEIELSNKFNLILSSK